jgi:chemotaxis protein MotB
MKNQHVQYLLLGTGLLFTASCVSTKTYNELKQQEQTCQDEKSKCLSRVQELTDQVNALGSDTAQLGEALRNRLAAYERLQSVHDSSTAGSDVAIRDLMKRLQAKEDSLKVRENNLAELRRVVAQRDSAVTAIRRAVSDALLGFENNGLTIEQKNGMVYVSLEERLLFASGSTVVDKKGEEALKGLADVLAKNKDINVTVEGHTDVVPISSGPIKDNWDLSVLRATEVVRIITRNKEIDPSRIIASGRGPFVPIDPANTPEARRKNRRTEIILVPKFNELMKVLETQQ